MVARLVAEDHGRARGDRAVWEVGGRIVAWAVDDGSDVSECVAPALREDAAIFAAMSRWIDERSPWNLRYVRDDDSVGIARLEAAGYRSVSAERMIAFSIDLANIPRTRPVPRVSAVAQTDDIFARVSVTYAAFGVDRSFEDYVAAYRCFMESPAYPSGWDLVAWTASGEAAACCIAWPDQTSGVGNLEPVAAHPRFHRQGYATALLGEGLAASGKQACAGRSCAPRARTSPRSLCTAPPASCVITSNAPSGGPLRTAR